MRSNSLSIVCTPFFGFFKSIIKALMYLGLFVSFYLEFVKYWTLSWTWLEKPECQTPYCTKILLVSDPQIVGPEWHGFSIMDSFAIWDSDRYIRRTFLKALNFIKPDIIIFLGDMTDQGYKATDPEFNSYFKRLQSIFEIPEYLQSTKIIYSAGDNDIGGLEEILLPRNVDRFNKMFNVTDDCFATERIEICLVNLITVKLQSSKYINSDIIRIALSHVPLISKERYFLREVVRKIRPHLIFSGHEHISSHYTVPEHDLLNYKHINFLPGDTEPRTYKFHEGIIHEIMVPTCSYRMGVVNMAYGVAFIDVEKKLVSYYNLWLPGRFLPIFIYTITIIPLLVAFLVTLLRRLKKYIKHKRSLHTYGNLPLYS